MEKFVPVHVDLPKIKTEPKVKFTPIVVDTTYPKTDLMIDGKLSVIPTDRIPLSEWGEKFNISVLHQRPLSHMNHSSGIVSTMTTTLYEKIENFFFGRWLN